MVELTQENFTENVLNAKGTVVVDFWAEWCRPCLSMIPALEKLNEEITVMKVNVDKEPELAQMYRVQGLPTLMAFKDGNIESSVSGAMPLHQLRSKLGV